MQKKIVLNTKVTRDEEAIPDSSNSETLELYDGEWWANLKTKAMHLDHVSFELLLGSDVAPWWDGMVSGRGEV